MKYSIYQMEVVPGNPEKNREKVEQWIADTVPQEKPDTVVLPEMWTTGYALKDLDQLADVDGEPTTSFLQQLAAKYAINIIGGSFANKKNNDIFNSSVAINRSGEVCYRYDKIHLVPMLQEHLYLTGGKNRAEVFELDGVKMGLIICFDLRFPEILRKLALEDVQVVHIVAEWPTARKDHWRVLQMARAIENQLFVVSCNNVGEFDGVTYAGMSMAIDPWGEVLIEGTSNKEETISVSLQLDKADKIKQDVPVFSSRVPELY